MAMVSDETSDAISLLHGHLSPAWSSLKNNIPMLIIHVQRAEFENMNQQKTQE
uniref:Uncharacterized protein n=1 Tax=Arion vulgaris TaxID=1028688 RepID=A0A0B7B6T7_9EUPU